MKVLVFLLITLINQLLCLQPKSLLIPKVVNSRTLNQNLLLYSQWRYMYPRKFISKDEKSFRQIIFLENLKKISLFNNDPKNTYKMGLNQFSDLTKQEFVARYLSKGIKIPKTGAGLAGLTLNNKINLIEDPKISLIKDPKIFNIPAATKPSSIIKLDKLKLLLRSVDWRVSGAVTDIKQQGTCGSCWAFASAALMESWNLIKFKAVRDFSEQQLVDCVNKANGYKSDGCNSGYQDEALSYAIKNGILNENQYSYSGVAGTCQVSKPTSGYYPKSFRQVGNSLVELIKALDISPVMVALDASNWGPYASGIFNGCSSTVTINHSVLLIGYDYLGNWIIKNSWSPFWGESGYITLQSGNVCGLLNYNHQLTG